MKIPKNDDERELFYMDLVRKCLVSRENRKSDYQSLRSWYLFGCNPEEAAAQYNKINPHIDQLTSFLYSAETTRFAINLGAGVHPQEQRKVPILTRYLNDEWLESNADMVFSNATTWALVYGSTFIKHVVAKGGKLINIFMVDPGSFGVLREDLPTLHAQEAFVHCYYITKTELYNRLYEHPKRESIVKRISSQEHVVTDVPSAIDRIVMSAVNPTIYGNVNLNLSGTNRMKAEVGEDTVEMRELYVWNDDEEDYQIVTMADPDIYIYDRALGGGKEKPRDGIFLKGINPFTQIMPTPQYDYFWGASEVQKLVPLQTMRNNRISEILDLLSKQVQPPTFLSGFTGILDEKDFALNRAGGLLANDMPGSKAEKLAPEIPPDLFKEIEQIDKMFAEASGISSILSGQGEQGVRSAGHASQLARLGASRAKKRAIVIQDSLEAVATTYLKALQVYDNAHLSDVDGHKFIVEQFTNDFAVKVDAHSNSPIFMEDARSLAFNLFKAGAIDKESLLDLLEPPMKQLLKDRLKLMEQKQAMQPQQPDKKSGKPDLKAVGGE